MAAEVEPGYRDADQFHVLREFGDLRRRNRQSHHDGADQRHDRRGTRGEGGGGIANGGSATLNNSLMAGNSGGDIEFGNVSGDNNLIDDPANAGGLTNDINGNIVGVDPLLSAPGNFGGPTQTIALFARQPRDRCR